MHRRRPWFNKPIGIRPILGCWVVLLGSSGLGTLQAAPLQEDDQEVTVTIKELNLEDSIKEFKEFQQKLDEYRKEVAEGQRTAGEIAAMIGDLRESASEENEFNHGPILEAIESYVGGVMVRKADLVDFLESQRYRIAYYANKMASSVRSEDVALLFGTREQNIASIQKTAANSASMERAIATFLESLPQDEFDLQTFQPLPGMSADNRKKLQQLEYQYQSSKDALEISKSRLKLVEEAHRAAALGSSAVEPINVDLLLTQMFGALDRIRLQMAADLMYLESYLSHYERSSRAQEVFGAFHQLIQMQGGIEGPSEGLANVLDWLQEGSQRQLGLTVDGLTSGAGSKVFPRSSDLLREAYLGARGRNFD